MGSSLGRSSTWPNTPSISRNGIEKLIVIGGDGTLRSAMKLAEAAGAAGSDIVFVSGAIGGLHAGVEYGWWEGLTACSSVVATDGDPLEAIMNAPLIRCDAAPWDLFGISLAGWNFLISCGVAITIWVLQARSAKSV